jgi:hypothetical protein
MVDTDCSLVVHCKKVFDAAGWDGGSAVSLGIAVATINVVYAVSAIVLERRFGLAVCGASPSPRANYSPYDRFI